MSLRYLRRARQCTSKTWLAVVRLIDKLPAPAIVDFDANGLDALESFCGFLRSTYPLD